MKKETIIIFISGLNLYKSPDLIQKAIASDEASGPTPIIAVCDAAVEKLIGVVPYFDMKDVNGFTAVRTALGNYRGVPFEAPTITYQSETWTDSRGRSLEAAFVASTPEMVTLRLSNGKLSTMSLSKLSEAGRKRVAELSSDH